MEEPTPYHELASSESICSSEAPSAYSDSAAEHTHTHIITQLLALKLPIFTFTLATHLPRDDDFSRQEMLKQKILSYNRKEKSLEELSKKFIDRF